MREPQCKREPINLAEKNGVWKGDDVGLVALHAWIKRRLKKPERCENCRNIKKLDLANISGKYLRILTDWKWLCRKCHVQSDGRMKNLLCGWKKKKLHPCLMCKAKTYRLKFCTECAKERRRLKWKEYNKKRKK